MRLYPPQKNTGIEFCNLGVFDFVEKLVGVKTARDSIRRSRDIANRFRISTNSPLQKSVDLMYDKFLNPTPHTRPFGYTLGPEDKM